MKLKELRSDYDGLTEYKKTLINKIESVIKNNSNVNDGQDIMDDIISFIDDTMVDIDYLIESELIEADKSLVAVIDDYDTINKELSTCQEQYATLDKDYATLDEKYTESDLKNSELIQENLRLKFMVEVLNRGSI